MFLTLSNIQPIYKPIVAASPCREWSAELHRTLIILHFRQYRMPRQRRHSNRRIPVDVFCLFMVCIDVFCLFMVCIDVHVLLRFRSCVTHEAAVDKKTGQKQGLSRGCRLRGPRIRIDRLLSISGWQTHYRLLLFSFIVRLRVVVVQVRSNNLSTRG